MKKQYIDLHFHSYYSDGNCSPEAMVNMAEKIGLTGLALTDHDEVAGIKEAKTAAEAVQIPFICGAEFSTFYKDEEIHILAYNISPDDGYIAELINTAREAREEAQHEMIKKLQKTSVHISIAEWNNEKKIFKPGDGGWPLLNLLKKKGYVEGPPDYFKKYFAPDAPCFVPFQFSKSEDVIVQIRKNGALPVLAHPGSYKKNEFSKRMLFHFMDYGLKGIEAYSIYHNEQFTLDVAAMGARNNLIITGGSDCHGDENAIVKRPLGGANVPAELFDAVASFKSAE